MSFNLVLNSTNNVGSNANTFVYNFIGGNFQVKDDMEICLAQATIPYSFYNITTAQTITINWTVGEWAHTFRRCSRIGKNLSD